MIINTGQRTDIPAFYSKWFAARLKQGYVCVRNPYNSSQVSRYTLDPSVVDVIGFCTKNPEPMFSYMELLKDYGQHWYVTITPYGRDIEPYVPDKHRLLSDFKRLSTIVGSNAVGWRYDPIFLSERYNMDYHIKAFKEMAEELKGYTDTVVISFIQFYEKVKRNFGQVKEVSYEDKITLGRKMIGIATDNHMTLKTCAAGSILDEYGGDSSGCMTIDVYEKAIGLKLDVPKRKNNRSECACYLACDIGAYDTCMHMCRYCYANNNIKNVIDNNKRHNQESPFLIGDYMEGDVIHEVRQESWINRQMSLMDFNIM